MDEISIVDTTLRDGDISLWAYGMTTGMMLPALRHMDEAGFDSMEFFLSLRFKKFVREHKENPPGIGCALAPKKLRRRGCAITAGCTAALNSFLNASAGS